MPEPGNLIKRSRAAHPPFDIWILTLGIFALRMKQMVQPQLEWGWRLRVYLPNPGFIVQQFLNGGPPVNGFDGRLQFLPEGHEGALSVKGTIALGGAAYAAIGFLGVFKTLENVSYGDVGRRAPQLVAAIKAAFGDHQIGLFKMVEDNLQKTRWDGLGLGYLCRFNGALVIVLCQFENGAQRVLHFLGN
jgi:hypothetical protein